MPTLGSKKTDIINASAFNYRQRAEYILQSEYWPEKGITVDDLKQWVLDEIERIERINQRYEKENALIIEAAPKCEKCDKKMTLHDVTEEMVGVFEPNVKSFYKCPALCSVVENDKTAMEIIKELVDKNK